MDVQEGPKFGAWRNAENKYRRKNSIVFSIAFSLSTKNRPHVALSKNVRFDICTLYRTPAYCIVTCDLIWPDPNKLIRLLPFTLSIPSDQPWSYWCRLLGKSSKPTGSASPSGKNLLLWRRTWPGHETWHLTSSVLCTVQLDFPPTALSHLPR